VVEAARPDGEPDGDAEGEPDGEPATGDDPADGGPAGGSDGEPVPIDQVLTELLSAMWSSLEATPGYQLLTYELTVTALRSPELDGVAQAQYQASREAAVAALEYAAAVAGVTWSKPVQDLARIVISAIDGAALAWLVDKDADAAKRTLAGTVDLLSSCTQP
jgi:hypothetical protein